MRLFKDFPEARNEIKRDLAELGTTVRPETMQHFDVKGNEDFATKEITNYAYTVLDPDFTEVEGVHEDWVEQEWQDRVTGGLNPGRAWRKRRDVWEPLMEKRDRHESQRNFSYTYSDRMGGEKIDQIVEELERHPHSRQLWLPVWWGPTDNIRRGKKRVPCSLGYWFDYRGDPEKLHMTYMMRSCDFATHYPNDVCLATLLLYHVAERAKVKVGTFTHFIGSFHVYAKDVAEVF